MTGFTRVDNDLLPKLAEISNLAINVYVTLKSHADENGECFPSIETIASRSKMSERKVREIIKALIDAKPPLLEKTRRSSQSGRLSNIYRFPSPAAPHAGRASLAAPHAGRASLAAPHAGSKGRKRHDMPPLTAPGAAANGTTCRVTRTTEQEPLNKTRERGSAASSSSSRKKQTKQLGIDDLPANLRTDRFLAVWRDWEAHRHELRKPLTPTSVKRQLTQFARWGETRSIAAIEHTIAQGWQGIREPDPPRHGGNGQAGGNHATPLSGRGELIFRKLGDPSGGEDVCRRAGELLDHGEIAEADVWDAVEATTDKKPDNPVRYFQRVLESKAGRELFNGQRYTKPHVNLPRVDDEQ